MMLSGVRVAVTGASGFCGRAVAVAAADRGARVLCLGRRPGPVGSHRYWDAARDTPDLADVDVVVHCAGAVGDPGSRRSADAAFHAVNVDGAARLLDAADGRPVVWVSSASVYDPRLDRSLVGEDHPIGGQLNAYGRSKAAGERLALRAGAVVLRPRAVYGPGDPHLVPRLRSRVRAGLLPLPGADVSLSLTAVENLADACLAAFDWPAGPYNVADAAPYARDTVVREVLAATGTPVRVVHVPTMLVTAAVRAAEFASRRRAPAEPSLTAYAVDQLAHAIVLDLSRARARNWHPRRTLADYLRTLRPASAAATDDG
jgi:nucleoside-diphosphate-sugar epimerase